MRKNVIALSLLFFAFTIFQTPAAEAASKKHDNSNYDAHELKAPMELGGVPTYPGKTQFQAGVITPNAVGGCTYNQRFITEEDTNTLLGWYRQALTGNWKVDPTSTAGTTIAARDRDKNLFQLTVFSSYPSGKHFRTEYLIIFKAAKPE